MAELAEVVTIYDANASDIPAMARRLADDIEAGKYGAVKATALVLVSADGVEVFGWGSDMSDHYRAIGVLTAGAHSLASAL